MIPSGRHVIPSARWSDAVDASISKPSPVGRTEASNASGIVLPAAWSRPRPESLSPLRVALSDVLLALRGGLDDDPGCDAA